jgi:hypothetical protein
VSRLTACDLGVFVRVESCALATKSTSVRGTSFLTPCVVVPPDQARVYVAYARRDRPRPLDIELSREQLKSHARCHNASH